MAVSNNKLAKKEKGPNEYYKMEYFNITSNPTVYYIYDERQHKVIGLNKDSELISKYKIPSYYSYFLVEQNGDIILFKCNGNDKQENFREAEIRQ